MPAFVAVNDQGVRWLYLHRISPAYLASPIPRRSAQCRSQHINAFSCPRSSRRERPVRLAVNDQVVRWLYLHRAEGGTAGAITTAAAGGHVRVLDWLARNTALMVTTTRDDFFRGTSVLNPSALDRAAANGHLGVLR